MAISLLSFKLRLTWILTLVFVCLLALIAGVALWLILRARADRAVAMLRVSARA